MSRFRYRSLFKNESKVTNKIVIAVDEDGTISIRNRWASPVSIYFTNDEANKVQVASDEILEFVVQNGDSVTVEEVSFDAFRNWITPGMNVNTQELTCKRGFITGVSAHIESMPDITKFTSFANKTVGGQYMFSGFNSYGTITSFPAGSFDLSKLTALGTSNFAYFNFHGALTSLPVGSFDISNVTLTSGCFWAFNAHNTALTQLPAGSFRLNPAVTKLPQGSFNGFNQAGPLTSLPVGSFNTENITHLTGYGLRNFNSTGGALTSLPAGSFRFDNLTSAVFYDLTGFNNGGKLTSLPAGSFNFSSLVNAGQRFCTGFNWGGKLESLPEGAFTMPNLESCGYEFLHAFNAGGALTSLPEGFAYTPKLRFTNLTSATSYLGIFNGQNGKIKSLPNLSFANSTQYLNMLPNGFMSLFNGWTSAWWYATTGGSLESLPAGTFRFDAIEALSDEEFATAIGTGVFSSFNMLGRLKALPMHAFNLGHANAGLTTATNFASGFNGGVTSQGTISQGGDIRNGDTCRLYNITNAPIKQVYVNINSGAPRIIIETPPGGRFQW